MIYMVSGYNVIICAKIQTLATKARGSAGRKLFKKFYKLGLKCRVFDAFILEICLCKTSRQSLAKIKKKPCKKALIVDNE